MGGGQERWHIQQENVRLSAQRRVFEEERSTFLRRMEEDRDQVQQAKVQ